MKINVKKLTFPQICNITSYLLIFIFMGIVYVWLGTGGTWRWGNESYYGLLADAFLKGQTHLLIEPTKTYLMDLSVFNNKYYLYWGPVPSIIFNIPARIFFKSDFPDSLAAFIFIYGVFTLSSIILIYFKNRYFKDVPHWLCKLSILAIGFGNLGPYLMGYTAGWIISIYAIAITSGSFFLLLGLFLLILEKTKNRFNLIILSLSGLSFGLSVGSRWNLIVAVIVIVLLFTIFLIFNFRKKLKYLWKIIVSLLLPLIICLLLLGTYNYIRFGNFLEFGIKYQNANTYNPFIYSTNIKLFSKSNFFCYFLKPPILINKFPFIRIGNFVRAPIPELFSHERFYFDDAAALYLVSPYIIAVFFFSIPILISKLKRKKLTSNFFFAENYNFLLLTLISTTILLIATHFLLPAASLRQVFDYSTFVLLFSSLIWLLIFKYTPSNSLKIISSIFIIIFAILTIYIGFALGFNGYYCTAGNIRQGNPDLYRYLLHIFSFN